MRVKILLYNILNGFCGDRSPFIIDSSRLRSASTVLTREKPDILILNEAFLWPFAQQTRISNYRTFFNQLYNFYVPPSGAFRWAPVVLSRFPVTWEDRTTRDWKFLQSELAVGRKKLQLYAIHPSHDSTDAEKTVQLNRMFDTHGVPDILVGDMNALSPQDSYDAARLTRGFQRFRGEDAAGTVRDLLEKHAIASVLKRGLIDTFHCRSREFEYTMPTDMRSKHKDSAVRIDYIFCNQRIRVVDSGVVKNQLTDMASDHYPVYAILNI